MRPRVTDAQRRARLVARHHLDRGADDPVAVTRAVVALHSSAPETPPLACYARVPGFSIDALETALYEDRVLWRLHAMRRTLFVVAADEAPLVEAAAGRDVAARERRRLEGWLAAELPADEVRPWLDRVAGRVLEVLAAGDEWRTQELTAAIPELATEVTLGSGRWATRSPVSSRLLFLLAMEGRLVRTRPAGSWRSSQYRWAATRSWFGAEPARLDPTAARTALARRYLATHGPATATDLKWWTGWTVAQTRQAAAAAGAVEVDLDGGAVGLVLEDDLEEVVTTDPELPARPVVALLPGLDPTPMGWKQRDWFLRAGADRQFDANGNVGSTVWVDGQAVGAWGQRPDGEVVVRYLDDVAADAVAAVEREGAALAHWLGGVAVAPRFATPLVRELSA